MRMLKHDHVIRLFGKRECGNVHYLILEYADGGELFDRIGKEGCVLGGEGGICPPRRVPSSQTFMM